MSDAEAFVCLCLNIRISPSHNDPSPSPPPSQPESRSDFKPVFVSEDGVSVKLAELTLKIRSGVHVSSDRHKRQSTAVKCLVCERIAYRVITEEADVSEAKEGPIMPGDDWVEIDVLKSKDGWVEVNVGPDGCVSESEANQAAKQLPFFRHYGVCLPTHNDSGTTNFHLPRTKLKFTENHSLLPNLPQFLPPPPFTPPHPIFIRMSLKASSLSESIRARAHERIRAFAGEELVAVEREENELKDGLEALWIRATQSINAVDNERVVTMTPKSMRQNGERHADPRPSSLPAASAIRDFMPSTYHGPRTSIVGPAAQPSALSASLVTSGLHFPPGRHLPVHGSSVQSNRINSLSQSAVVTSTSPATPSTLSSGSSPRSSLDTEPSLRRNLNERTDVSATFRYYHILDLEAKQNESKQNKVSDEVLLKSNEKDAVIRDGSGGNRNARQKFSLQATDVQSESSNAESSRQRRNSGKRKVTFDVQPDVVTIKREIISEADTGSASTGPDELIFDLDGEFDGASEVETLPDQTASDSDGIPGDASLSVSDEYLTPGHHREGQSISRSKPKSIHDQKHLGLPMSFASLRPSSLPVPSHVRPALPSREPSRSSNTYKEESIMSRNSRSKGKGYSTRTIDEESPPTQANPLTTAYNAELRRLVGAHMPSHRGSWTDKAEVWRKFRGTVGNSKSNTPYMSDEEGNDADHWTGGGDVEVNLNGMSKSVPISMTPTPVVKEEEYARSIAVPPLVEIEGKPASSYRADVYLRRDLLRNLDPGCMVNAESDDDDDGADAHGMSSGISSDARDAGRNEGDRDFLELVNPSNSAKQPSKQ